VREGTKGGLEKREKVKELEPMTKRRGLVPAAVRTLKVAECG
jgi:hypothetical protein